MKTLVGALLLTLAIGCGAAPENPGADLATASQAFTNQGQICGGRYSPYDPAYPYPTKGWCEWMPGVNGLNEAPCSQDSWPDFAGGDVFAFSGNDWTGACAHWPHDTYFTFKEMAVNGWDNIDYYGNPQDIRSLRIGPHTLFYGWDGPYYSGNAITFTNPTDIDSLKYNLAPHFQLASIMTFQYFGAPDPTFPVERNIAPGRPTTQSSTAYGGSSARAVDGNVDGNYSDGSVTHTDLESQPWWQVDLGPQSVVATAPAPWVELVEIYNRTDCCADRLTNFNVWSSIDGSQWVVYPVTGQAGSPTRVLIEHYARYIKVQLTGTNYLSLAEVTVWGH
jgi:hypothetical protein